MEDTFNLFRRESKPSAGDGTPRKRTSKSSRPLTEASIQTKTPLYVSDYDRLCDFAETCMRCSAYGPLSLALTITYERPRAVELVEVVQAQQEERRVEAARRRDIGLRRNTAASSMPLSGNHQKPSRV